MPLLTNYIQFPNDPINWSRNGQVVSGDPDTGDIEPSAVVGNANRPSAELAENLEDLRSTVEAEWQFMPQAFSSDATEVPAALIKTVYVDNIDGLDSNDGSAEGEAVQTLKQAFTMIRNNVVGGAFVYIKAGSAATPRTYAFPTDAGFAGFSLSLFFFNMQLFPSQANTQERRDNTFVDASSLNVAAGGRGAAFAVEAGETTLTGFTIKSPYVDLGGAEQWCGPCVDALKSGNVRLQGMRFIPGSNVTHELSETESTLFGRTSLLAVTGGQMQLSISLGGIASELDGSFPTAKLANGFSIARAGSIALERTDLIDLKLGFVDNIEASKMPGGFIFWGINNTLTNVLTNQVLDALTLNNIP
jgi:hypothetical protein